MIDGVFPAPTGAPFELVQFAYEFRLIQERHRPLRVRKGVGSLCLIPLVSACGLLATAAQERDDVAS